MGRWNAGDSDLSIAGNASLNPKTLSPSLPVCLAGITNARAFIIDGKVTPTAWRVSAGRYQFCVFSLTSRCPGLPVRPPVLPFIPSFQKRMSKARTDEAGKRRQWRVCALKSAW